jgi:hypothetical protein
MERAKRYARQLGWTNIRFDEEFPPQTKKVTADEMKTLTDGNVETAITFAGCVWFLDEGKGWEIPTVVMHEVMHYLGGTEFQAQQFAELG